ncbi:ADP-ribosylation factor-like protein 4A [Mya arenaria]|uniref:ADP-ribosylation factor-like protein 4A n=1 Tax=Mya arenaria TaxID=6604 RepID=UPI0022E63154|nr:ADP-ribosylation factor-like protein 4A [Mya arenaria]
MGGSSSTQVTMLGLDSAGKTTCLYRLKFGQYTESRPTVGFNCEKIQVENSSGKTSNFTVWDVGGHDKTRPLWKSYCRKSDGIIYVVDSTDKERLEEAKVELVKILKAPEIAGLPVVILANKQDLPGSLSGSDVESVLAMRELPTSQLWHVEPTCGVTGEGLEEAVEKIADLIEKKRKGKRKR